MTGGRQQPFDSVMMASVIGLGTVEMRAICHRVLVDVVRGYVQTEAGTPVLSLLWEPARVLPQPRSRSHVIGRF